MCVWLFPSLAAGEWLYSGTPLIRTPMGPIAIVLISGVSAFQGVKIYSSNGDTFRSFRAKCPLNRGVRISEVRISGVPLYIIYTYMYVHVGLPFRLIVCHNVPCMLALE